MIYSTSFEQQLLKSTVPHQLTGRKGKPDIGHLQNKTPSMLVEKGPN